MNLASARSRMYDYIESIEEKTSRVVGEEKKVERNVDYSLVLRGITNVWRLTGVRFCHV